MRAGQQTRIHWQSAAAFFFAAIVTFPARGDVARVPISLQVAFIIKIADYDRQFARHVESRVQILLLVKSDNVDSSSAADELKAAFSQAPTIGGKMHDDTIMAYTSAPALADVCRQRNISILVLTPGFANEIENIDRELKGIHVLSASVIAEDVKKGIVFGVDLVDARPKLVFNLRQARLQDIDMEAKALNLMKVYE